MHRSSQIPILFIAAIAAAQDTSKPQFTARELFYSAASAPAPAAPKLPPPPAAAPPKTTAAAAPHKDATPPKKAPAPAPTQTATVTPPAPAPASQHTPPVRLPEGATIIKASTAAPQTAPAPSAGPPLGLKYSVLRKSGDDMVEVPEGTVFNTGDRIQLSVQTNGPGYLYIVSQGSSGNWQPMFPSPEVEDGNNHVDGWSPRMMPPGTRMRFDDQPGTEKIFIVFSRTPETGLENLIYSLQGSKVKPAKAEEKTAPKHMVQIAQVDDATVGHLRETYTRDLIIEKVDDKTSGEKKETAVYVVNPTGSSESRVVAYITLVHQ